MNRSVLLTDFLLIWIIKLITHPYLATLGLSFNTFLGLAICLECCCGIGSKSIEAHLHDVHKEEEFRIDHVKLKKALSDLQAKESFDVMTLPPSCYEIEGLALCSNAYMCSICQLIRGSLLSIKQHHFDVHKDVDMPTSWTQVAAQQIHHNNRTRYFRVVPRVQSASKVDDVPTRFFLSLHEERQKMVADYDMSKIDPRQVSTWLNVTKWHVLVAPYDHRHLLSLVTMPTRSETELEILAKAVSTYVWKADQAIDTLSNLALRIINSPEPP
jgi:hypothetical protein